MSEEQIKCDRCNCDYSEEYFKDKYTNEIICLQCLLDSCETSTTTHYMADGNYFGSDDDINEVVENICDYTSFEKIKEDK